MLHSKIFRISLLLIILAALSLISISLVKRIGERQEETLEEILPAEVVRRTTEFEHTQRKNGKVLFRVIGGSSTMKSDGDNVLERVSLWRYGDSSEPSDMIEGEQAVYNPENKEILFAGDVVIRLEVGILIFADQARGDLEKEELVIPGEYRMEHDSVVGSGKGLEYLFKARRLRFLEGVEMVMDAVSDPKEVSSGRGEYFIDSGRITLEEKAMIEGRQVSLSGGRIIVDLDAEGHLSLLRAWNEARLDPGEGQAFTGNRIVLDISGTKLEVYGDHRSQAVYVGNQDGSNRQISADSISCSFLSPDSEAWELRRIRAEGNVDLKLPESGLLECRSEIFEGTVSSSTGSGFEKIEMSGEVFISRERETGLRESLEAGRIVLALDDQEIPDNLTAERNVLVEMPAGLPGEEQGYRRLEVKDVLFMDYQDGLIHKAEGRLGCRMQNVTALQEEKVESDTIEIAFSKGLLSRIEAVGNVRGSSRIEGVERTLISSKLEVYYQGGLFSRFEQSGGSTIRQVEDQRTIEVSSERNHYELSSQVLTAEGGEPLLVISEQDEDGTREFETRAKKILIGSGDGSVNAEGEVESVYDLRDSNLIFVSSSMKNDPEQGVVEYSGNVRLLLEENIIRGEKMILDPETKNLSVSGGVDSQLVAEGEEGSEEYRIRSGGLELSTVEGTATYTDDVKLDSKDLEIEAPVLVLYMDSGQMKELSRIEAWGGVRILEKGRLWTGEKAIYLKETGKVTVD